MGLISNIEKEVVRKRKRMFVEALEQMASHFVDEDIRTSKQKVSDGERDKKIKEAIVEFKTKLDKDPHSFDPVVTKYVGDLKAGRVLAPSNILSQEAMTTLGVHTATKKFAARGAEFMSSRLRETATNISMKDLGISVDPEKKKRTGMFAAIGMGSFGKRLQTFDPNKDNKSATFGSAQTLDTKSFQKDEAYRREMLNLMRHIDKNGADSTKEEKLLAKEIKKMSDRSENSQKYIDHPEDRMTKGGAALYDIGKLLFGAGKKLGGAILDTRMGSKKEVPVIEPKTEMAVTYPVKNNGLPASMNPTGSLAAKFAQPANDNAEDIKEEDQTKKMWEVWEKQRLEEEKMWEEYTKENSNAGASWVMPGSLAENEKSGSTIEAADEEQDKMNEIQITHYEKVDADNAEIISGLKEINETEKSKSSGGMLATILAALLGVGTFISGIVPAITVLGSTLLTGLGGILSNAGSVLGKASPLIAAGAAGIAVGTALYENSETVRDASGSVMESMFGHIDTAKEADEKYKNSPEGKAQIEQLKKNKADRLAYKDAAATVAKEDKADKRLSTAINLNAAAPSASAPIISNNTENKTGRESPRNQDNVLNNYLNSRVIRFA